MIRAATPRARRFPPLLLAVLLLPGAGTGTTRASDPTPPSPPATAPASTLDLEAAIRHALDFNRTLTLRALGADRATLGADQAHQEFTLSARPTTLLEANDESGGGGYNLTLRKKYSPGTELMVGGGSTRLPAFIDDDWRSSVRVELRQPLFGAFGPLIHMEPVIASNERVLAEQRAWEQQKNDLVLDVARTFESILRLKRQIAAGEALVLRTETLAELTLARQHQGRATRVDSLRANMQSGEARLRLQTQVEELYSAQRNLAELLGAEPEAEFELEAPPLLELVIPTATDAAAIALSNRMDFAQALQDLDSTRRGQRITRRRSLPDMHLFGRHEQFGEGASLSDANSLEESRWIVGLESDYELNRTADRLANRVAALDVDAAREVVQIRAMSITREVQQALSSQRKASGNLTIATRNYELAAARAELARTLFEIGRGDSFAATDAEDALSNAELRMLQAREDCAVAAYALLRTLGILIEHPEHLKPAAVGTRG